MFLRTKVKLENTLKLKTGRELYAPGAWVRIPERWLHVDFESKVESLKQPRLYNCNRADRSNGNHREKQILAITKA